MERKIFVVSDSTGATAEHVLRAALAQFDAADVNVERRPQMRTLDGIRSVVDEARDSGAMLVHTLAATDLRREIYRCAMQRGVRSVDLLGNLLSDLSSFLGAPAGGVPGGIHPLEEADYRRVDALTFVVKHDDGLGMEDLRRADIVIVGISRTSKTPLSIYLAVRGFFVANIPIIEGVEPPAELLRIDHRRIVGLRMDPSRLRHVREQRLKSFKESARHSYTDASMIQKEVVFADELFKRFGWPVVDMTLKSLEEVAIEVISLATDLPYTRASDL
jgi:[pyruvate, water dikinase]-phosphate phosphotransferase / [pyruvate, water dikinase] kinase